MLQLKISLNEFDTLPIEDSLWEELGELLFKLKTKGLQVPIQDAAIALLAIRTGIPVWTTDRHFLQIQSISPSLVLYKI